MTINMQWMKTTLMCQIANCYWFRSLWGLISHLSCAFMWYEAPQTNSIWYNWLFHTIMWFSYFTPWWKSLYVTTTYSVSVMGAIKTVFNGSGHGRQSRPLMALQNRITGWNWYPHPFSELKRLVTWCVYIYTS